MPRTFHLAQINIARMRYPLDDPRMQSFVDQLDPVNALAESSPGFVWRLQSAEGDATSMRPFGDDVLVNMSVWESVEALEAFAYRSAHTEVLRQRKEWFDTMESRAVALWWVPAGTQPTPADARRRLDLLDGWGESPLAFTFKKRFPPPPATPVQYGGRRFTSAANTANGDVTGATTFDYRHEGDTVWATYSGGSVRFGTLLAKVDPTSSIDMRYQHLNEAGEFRTGECWSAPELLPDGRVRLHEYWQWTNGDRSRGQSVIEEIADLRQ